LFTSQSFLLFSAAGAAAALSIERNAIALVKSEEERQMAQKKLGERLK
jgi:hypothetical protein